MLAEYGSQLLETRTVYYNGTAALRQGQPLFYLDDAATGIKTPSATQSDGSLYPKSARMGQAVDALGATGANYAAYAGIVSDAYVGQTGPRYIDIVMPKKGDVLQIEVTNRDTIAKAVSTTVGSLLTLPGTNASNTPAYGVKATPVVADGSVFLALEAVTQNAGTPGTDDVRSVIWALCVR